MNIVIATGMAAKGRVFSSGEAMPMIRQDYQKHMFNSECTRV